MGFNGTIREIVRAFYFHEINDFCLYIEGFGGLFISRTKDGMVMSYKDASKRFGPNDHVTVLFDERGISSVHRKLEDTRTSVYMKYGTEYFVTRNGIKRLVQDMQRQSRMSLGLKIVLMLGYRLLNWSYETTHHKDFRVLKKSEAIDLGMKPPCIYVKLRSAAKLFFIPYGRIISLQARSHKWRFGESPSRGFLEQSFPGSKITKKRKKKERN